LDISDLCLAGVKHGYFKEENKRYMVFLFKTNNYTGTLIEQTEEGDVFWIKKDALLTLNLAKGFENTFEVLNNPLVSEERHFENAEKTGWECILL
jgi:8-oxo-dGTP diphosphatase